MHQRAYTLIEVLAVVIIVGLIAGIGIPPLVRQVESPPMDRACLLLQTADRHARQLAHTGAVEVDVRSDGMSHRTSHDEIRIDCDPDVTLTWLTTTGRRLHHFTLDHHGRSPDLVVEIAAGDERRRFVVSGISGEWSPQATTEAVSEVATEAPGENP